MTEKPSLDVLEAKLDALKELCNVQFKAQETAVNAALVAQKAGTDAAFAASEKALLLKTQETERRLDSLNGEAGRLSNVLNNSVPREVWEQGNKAIDAWKSNVDKTLATTEGKSRQTIYIVGLIIVGVQIALGVFMR